MGEENQNYIDRLEFDHFISEFEAFRDTILDQISLLRHEIEIIEGKIEDLKENNAPDTPSQSKLI